jgi:hypothetical protein
MLIVYRLTTQADIVKTLEKAIHSSQSPKHAKDQAKPSSNVAGVCIPAKERLYSCLYNLGSHVVIPVG